MAPFSGHADRTDAIARADHGAVTEHDSDSLADSPSPITKLIEEGEVVLLDCGGTFGGYWAEVAGRTLSAGPLTNNGGSSTVS
jgi:hypothetical protein